MSIEKDLLHSPARLDFHNVSVNFGEKSILENITFQVPHGARVAVVGPNGAGKSTLFKAMVGLLPITDGEIFIHGKPLGHHMDCVAYIPQREEVDWRFPVTVRDVVMMGRFGRIRWFKPPSQQDHQSVRKSLSMMDIYDLADRSINQLSGGQQQRVFLARALAQDPHILLMDEPFNGVDFATQDATLQLLDDLKKENVTVIVSTHDLNLASERFELVLLLNRNLIAFGPPAEVFTKEIIQKAFNTQVMMLDGAIVVDQCCGHNHNEGG
jgi:ABC-type Mn2+/Zn2+ transport system ATPase subunit